MATFFAGFSPRPIGPKLAYLVSEDKEDEILTRTLATAKITPMTENTLEVFEVLEEAPQIDQPKAWRMSIYRAKIA